VAFNNNASPVWFDEHDSAADERALDEQFQVIALRLDGKGQPCVFSQSAIPCPFAYK
jgi:hypothetical protein